MESATRVQILDEAVCISHSADTVGKGMHPTILLPAKYCSVAWGCRIRRLQFSRGVRLPPRNESHGYDTKQSDGEVPIMLKLWGMQSAPLLPSLPGPLWPGVVAPDRALFMG